MWVFKIHQRRRKKSLPIFVKNSQITGVRIRSNLFNSFLGYRANYVTVYGYLMNTLCQFFTVRSWDPTEFKTVNFFLYILYCFWNRNDYIFGFFYSAPLIVLKIRDLKKCFALIIMSNFNYEDKFKLFGLQKAETHS